MVWARRTRRDHSFGTRPRALALLVVVLASVPWVASPTEALPVALPATVVSVPMDVSYETYPSFASDGTEAQTAWRVVGGKSTSTSPGNYAEQYLSVTPSGRLLDFSTYPQFSDDRGETWFEARTSEPLFGNEGGIIAAPNGDVVAVDWYLEGGDRIVAFKYDHRTDEWTYSYAALHTPFADRPWLSIAPGPFELPGESEPVPYLAVLRGGFPKGDPPYYTSADGLNYVYPSYKSVEGAVATSDFPWPERKAPDMDYIQPQGQAAMFPSTRGLVAGSVGLAESWYEMTGPGVEWTKLQPRLEDGVLLTDSLGRLHHITFGMELSSTFRYSMSSDGGKTWVEKSFDLPRGYYAATYLSWDARTNAAAGVTAVAVHALSTETSQDLVYKFSTASDEPELERVYAVGRGDILGDGGLAAETSAARFDFASVAIFPDGRVATSFEDSQHLINTVAVEMETTPVEGAVPTAATTIHLPKRNAPGPGKRLGFTGDVASSGSVEGVQVALALTRRGSCRWLQPGEKPAAGPCSSPAWVDADGTTSWSFDTPRLAPGTYELRARAWGWTSRGVRFVETCCEAPRNLVRFRVR